MESVLPWRGASKTLLLGCLLVAALVRLQCAASTYLMDQDSPGYLKTAIRINESGLTGAVGSGDPHPFYPLAIALLQRLLGDYELAGLTISITFGSLATLFIYGAARRLSEAAGWAAALLYAVHPAFVGVQSEVMTDAASHLFVSVALYGFALWASDGRAFGLAILAAGCMLTWTVRLDGLILTPVLLVVTAALPLFWRPGRSLAWGGPILLGIMALAAIPAAILFFTLWGKGTITPRWPSSMDARIDESIIGNGISDSQAELPKKYDQYIGEHGLWIGSILYLVRILGIALYPLNAILLIVGLVQAIRLRRYRFALVVGSVGLIILVLLATGMVMIRYRMAPRYFASTVLALLPLTAVGLLEVSRWAGRRWAAAAPLTVVALLLVNLYPRIEPYRRYEHRGITEAADWIRGRAESEARLVWVGDPRFEWYLQPRKLLERWQGADLGRWVDDGRVWGVAVLQCAEQPDEVRALLERKELFEEPRVFPGRPGDGDHCVRLYVVRPPAPPAFSGP
jgi:hypothetical protein